MNYLKDFALDKLKIDKIELIRRLAVGRDKYRNLRTVFFLWNKVHHAQLSLEVQESVRIAAADAAVTHLLLLQRILFIVERNGTLVQP